MSTVSWSWPRLEKRSVPSQAMRYVAPLLAVGLMLVSGLVLFMALGRDPLLGFKVFFLNPFKDAYSLAELLLKAAPLALIALGLAVGFRANVWNIGAEGQFVLGAIGATGVALLLPLPERWQQLSLMAVAGAFGGALWAAIPAWLKTRFRTNEILSSLMLVYVALFLASYLVHGPWKDPAGFNFPQTAMFGPQALLPVLFEGLRLHAGLLVVLVVMVLGHVLLEKSFLGLQISVNGASAGAAAYAGFRGRTLTWLGLVIGGACAGLAGMFEVAGPMGQMTEHVASGYGFAAIIVAFLGRLNAAGIVLASLLMSVLFLGGEQAQQYLALPSSISKVFQGMLLFYLLGADILLAYRIRWRKTS